MHDEGEEEREKTLSSSLQANPPAGLLIKEGKKMEDRPTDRGQCEKIGGLRRVKRGDGATG